MKSLSRSRFAVGILASLGLAAGALVPQDPDGKHVAKERYEAALKVWTHLAMPTETAAECETKALWSRRVAEAAAESGALPAREAFAQHLARMKEIQVFAKELFEAGRRSAVDVAAIDFHVAEAKSLARR